jgi:hypothetical protein
VPQIIVDFPAKRLKLLDLKIIPSSNLQNRAGHLRSVCEIVRRRHNPKNAGNGCAWSVGAVQPFNGIEITKFMAIQNDVIATTHFGNAVSWKTHTLIGQNLRAIFILFVIAPANLG